MFSLSPRLQCAAAMADKNAKTVDIGTDHAYLPSYLVMNGIRGHVLACDIGEKPLLNAAKTVKSLSLQNQIELRISDGLEKVSSEEADEIIICGMGGTLISDILSACPWVKKQGMHLILQPMTHTEDVRRFLCENGFIIDKEDCVIDSHRLYCCISARYTGEQKIYDAGYYYFGTLTGRNGLAEDFVKKQYKRVDIKYTALTNAGFDTEETRMLYDVKKYYERLEDK